MSVIRVGPLLATTNLQTALDDLDTAVGGSPFLEDHFITVQEGSTASNIVIPSTLEPTTTFKLYISGEFRDRPVIDGDGTAAIRVTVPNVVFQDAEVVGNISGTFATDGAIVVDDGIDNFESLRNIVHDATTLINFKGAGSTGHAAYNNSLYNFSVDGIFKDGGTLDLCHNSGFNLDDGDTRMALVHGIDLDLTMVQNSWYVMGENETHYDVLIEEVNPPFSTFTFSKNIYFTGYAKLGSEAKIARRDILTKIIDHALVDDISGTTTFVDANADFVTDGITTGDVLTFETSGAGLVDGGSIVSAANVATYTVVTRTNATTLELDLNTTAEIGQFEYTITRREITEFSSTQLANWIDFTGEVGAGFGDPDYADLGVEGTGPTNLSLGALSPLIQFGTPLPAVPNDICGNLRPGDFITIGAYEARGTYTVDGILRVLELIGGLSTKGACKFVVGDEGELSTNPLLPEAPLQGNIGLDNTLAIVPIESRTVTDGGLLTLTGQFLWRYLIDPNNPCEREELDDGIVDTLSEIGILTEDNVLLFRMTFPELNWDPLSILTPCITLKLRFEGKVLEQEFYAGEGFRLTNDELAGLVFEDWETVRILP